MFSANKSSFSFQSIVDHSTLTVHLLSARHLGQRCQHEQSTVPALMEKTGFGRCLHISLAMKGAEGDVKPLSSIWYSEVIKLQMQ